MPTNNLIVQANIGPGDIISPNFTLPAGIVLNDVALVSSAWPDPSLLWSLDVERLVDGEWKHWFGASGTGEQGYDKQGNPTMPRFGVKLDGSQPAITIRATIRLNKRIRIGVMGVTG